MKVLLINPEKLIHPPFGLLYIGSMLRSSGHETVLREIPFGLKAGARGAIVDSLMDGIRPDVVGITSMTPQAKVAQEIVARIKSRYPRVKVIAGGVHPTVRSREALTWGADIAVRGEGERTVVEVLEKLSHGADLSGIKGITFSKRGEVIETPPRELIKDLDSLPLLDYGLLEGSRFKKRCYSIRGYWLKNGWIMTTRGCPGRCTFCASMTTHGRVVREFSVERMLDEVERLKKDYKIEGLWVFDDTFTLKEARVAGFCAGMISRKLGLVWACQARVDTFTPGMARDLKRSGCVQVDFGVESGSQKVLDAVCKGIKIEQTRRAFNLAKSQGLRVLATVMVGLPEELPEDVAKTEELLREIKPDFVVPSFTTPYPGTELYDMSVSKGWIDPEKGVDWLSTEEPVITPCMDTKSVKDAFERFMKMNRSVFLGYLAQPRFIKDVMSVFLRRPRYMLRLARCVLSGSRKDVLNLFLQIFRKEMVGDQ